MFYIEIGTVTYSKAFNMHRAAAAATGRLVGRRNGDFRPRFGR